MISNECLKAEWAQKFKKEKLYSKIDPTLLNKMIHAFKLLELLQSSGLEFIFKGGTSLILLLESPKRFSIDIDITTEESKDALEKVLDKIIDSNPFKKCVPDERGGGGKGAPKAHYKFFYDSEFQRGEAYILLDVLFEKNKYQELIKVPIDTNWIEHIDAPLLVLVPTIDAITGDKLTAFAPATVGIEYGKNKDLQIIKQLFDMGELFNRLSNSKTVYQTFCNIAKTEMEYRKLDISYDDVLDDIINTGLLISKRGVSKDPKERAHYKELASGLQKIKSHLIYNRFRVDEAIEASAKVAYLAAKFKKKDFSSMEYYSKETNFDNVVASRKKYSHLNKLSKLPNGSFYYWNKTIELIS